MKIKKTYQRKTVDKIKGCSLCGKKFVVRVRIKDNKIMTKCFYSIMNLNKKKVEYWECKKCL